MSPIHPGVVSVVIVNFRGVRDTITAIEYLEAVDWPADRLEIVVVENASGDDSLERLAALGDRITLVESTENLGFAGGCNLGVSRSSGEYVAFLNNDARPDAAWVRAAVARFETSRSIGAVASRVLDWEGKTVDFVDAGLTWYGMGYKPLTAEPYTDEHLLPGAPVLFGTGSSMFVRRSVYDELGGFDERYFMFFEDVDLGWRLNLKGWTFAYEPASLAYHRHHASMTSFGQWKESYLLERNALFTLYKNASDEMLAEVLPAAIALAVRRGISKDDLDTEELDIRRKDSDQERERPVAKDTLAPVYAIDRFVAELPSLAESRAEIQRSRVVDDARIRRLFRETDVPGHTDRSYLDGYVNVTNAFGVLEATARRRVLVVTGDPIGAKLAGPGIRSWHMAEVLSDVADVRLVSLGRMQQESPRFETTHVSVGDQRAMAKHEEWADVIVFQGLAMALFKSIAQSRKILVADVYDPMHLEQLEQARNSDLADWTGAVTNATEILNEQLARADFFLCASERQRFFYLGQLAALGRINPATYGNDPDLTRLIAVAPFGLSSEPPHHERDVLKGVLPGIGADDTVIVWGGGLYDWFDPATLIRAVAELGVRRPDLRLFFQGTKNPNPGVPEMNVVGQSRELARRLGVLDRSVFFNDAWVEYADRQNFLLEADAGVSTHFSHIETTFSFRTRILDYLWAGLPMVVTEGDSFADLIRDEELGIVVPAEDVGALADALDRITSDEEFVARARANIARVRTSFEWESALKPLVDFVAAPHAAADRSDLASATASEVVTRARAAARARRYGILHDLGRASHYLRTGGPIVVLGKVRNRVMLRIRRNRM